MSSENKDDSLTIKVEIKPQENSNELKFENLNKTPNDWQKTRELDFLIASRLVKDSKDLRNLTFKKTENHLK